MARRASVLEIASRPRAPRRRPFISEADLRQTEAKIDAAHNR